MRLDRGQRSRLRGKRALNVVWYFLSGSLGRVQDLEARGAFTAEEAAGLREALKGAVRAVVQRVYGADNSIDNSSTHERRD